MAYTQERAGRKWTYADYCTWPDNERWELIEGVAYNMTPAPSRQHQQISGALSSVIFMHLRGKPCKVYNAPFDVRLPDWNEQSEVEIETVVQPDILVVCDSAKLDDRGCKGAPDLIIEILSPTTAEHDMKSKFFLYQRVGVKSYWIVHPAEQTLMVFTLNDNGQYGRPDMYAYGDVVPVPLLGDLMIDLREVFIE